MNAAFYSQERPDVPLFTQTSLQRRSLSRVKTEEILLPLQAGGRKMHQGYSGELLKQAIKTLGHFFLYHT